MIKDLSSCLFWREATTDGQALSLNQELRSSFQVLFEVRRLIQIDDFTELSTEECTQCYKHWFEMFCYELSPEQAKRHNS